MPGCSGSANPPDAGAIAAAADVLRRGGVVVFPTETLYGLGVDAFNRLALERLVKLKGREPGKPIAVLISDTAMLRNLTSAVPAAAEVLMQRFWPGPLTLVLPARQSLSPLLTGGGPSIGVRLSSHATATALVRALGRPLTAPSANPAGMRPAARIEDARAYFDEQVDYYLDGGPLPGEPASTVVAVGAELRVIREGAIAAADVRASFPAPVD